MPRASVVSSLAEGWRRALRAPWVAGGTLTAAAVFGLPVALSLRDLVGEGLPWPADERTPGALVASAVAALVAWHLLAGGILDRLARGRPVGTAVFFAACGVHGLRFLRLTAVVAPAGWAAVAWLPPGPLPVAAIVLLHFVVDFARIRIVVEDRRSVIGAAASAIRFIRRRPIRTAGIYGANLVTLGAVWVVPAPVVAPLLEDLDGWRGAALGLVWLGALVYATLARFAAETVFFQGELAHAHYAAAPDVLWPDSPAAEAIENLRRRLHEYSDRQ